MGWNASVQKCHRSPTPNILRMTDNCSIRLTQTADFSLGFIALLLVRRLPQIYQGHMPVVRVAGFGGQGPCQGFAILFHQMAAELPVLGDIVIASKGVNDQVNGQVICMDPGMLCMRSCPAVGEALGNICRCGSTKIQKQIGNCRVLCVCGKTYFKHRARQQIPRCPCTPKRGRTHHVVANGHHVISKVKVPLYLCRTCNDSTSSGVSAEIKRATTNTSRTRRESRSH